MTTILKNKAMVIALAIASVFTMLLVSMGTAKADHGYAIGHFVPGVNSFITYCHSGTNVQTGYFEHTIYYNDVYSPCTLFSVGYKARIQYRSVSGATYWSRCGEDEPNWDNARKFGWEQVGNSVSLIGVARYPAAPAQNCDGIRGN